MTVVIPKAKAPEGKNFLYHLRAANDDLPGYLEHLATYGDIVQLSVFPAFLVNSPELVQQVLITQSKAFDKPANVKYAIEQLTGGENVFSADGEVWRVLRKAAQPAFHKRQIDLYFDIMANSTRQMMSAWNDGDLIDMVPATSQMTMSISTQALLGQDLVNQQAGQAILDFFDIFTDRIIKQFPVPDWLPIASNRRAKEAIETLDRLILPKISARKQAQGEEYDLLGLLLKAQRLDETGILTDAQIRNEILISFVAGYEVNSNSTAFTLYLLSQHPDILARVVSELDTHMPDGELTLERLQSLVYMEQVIKESMRILPATAIVTRQANSDVIIGDYHIPKNAQVFVAPWTLHRREDIFPNPQTFDPDRFSPDREKDIPKNAYIPFSTGPRICLGSAFAMMQLRVSLALILKHYRLDLVDGYHFELYWRSNTHIKNGLPVTVHNR